jgi:hypothetical protein
MGTTVVDDSLGRYEARRAQGVHPTSIEFPDDLYRALQEVAKREQRSMAAVVRVALTNHILTNHPHISLGVD